MLQVEFPQELNLYTTGTHHKNVTPVHNSYSPQEHDSLTHLYTTGIQHNTLAHLYTTGIPHKNTDHNLAHNRHFPQEHYKYKLYNTTGIPPDKATTNSGTTGTLHKTDRSIFDVLHPVNCESVLSGLSLVL